MNANKEAVPPTIGCAENSSAALLERILQTHPFLDGMSPHQIRLLRDCAMLVEFRPGEVLFREGDPANRFYLIHAGKVALESRGLAGSPRLVQNIGAGEVLGWSWLFPPYFWHFDARTVEPTTALFFYGTPLRVECESDHDLGYELLKRMSGIIISRLQATRKQLLDLRVLLK